MLWQALLPGPAIRLTLPMPGHENPIADAEYPQECWCRVLPSELPVRWSASAANLFFNRFCRLIAQGESFDTFPKRFEVKRRFYDAFDRLAERLIVVSYAAKAF